MTVNLLLADVHSGHVGASRMKELARCYLWWPNLDSDLEKLVKHCPECLETRNAPPKAGYTHGNGLTSHGLEFMLIMQVQYKANIF